MRSSRNPKETPITNKRSTRRFKENQHKLSETVEKAEKVQAGPR